jgi:hypothetical protein
MPLFKALFKARTLVQWLNLWIQTKTILPESSAVDKQFELMSYFLALVMSTWLNYACSKTDNGITPDFPCKFAS